MVIEQGLNSIELSEVEDVYNSLYSFLTENFKGFFYWDAFRHRFIVADKAYGRHENLRMLRSIKL